MILSDIGKVLWKALSAAVTTTSNIAFCAGSLVVGIIGEILFGMLSIMFGILISLFSVMAAIGFFIWLLEKPRDFDPFGQAGFAHLWLQYD